MARWWSFACRRWSLTLSDVPNPRTADVDNGVSDRRAALERGMFLRQLGQRQVHAFVGPLIKGQKAGRKGQETVG